MTDKHVITRQALLDGTLRQMIERSGHAHTLWTDAQREQSLAATLAARPGGPAEDVWLFGYGSLIWNPAFHYVERRPGRLEGFHRRYCLSTPLGRGTPEQPGLMLGLDEGGWCAGVAFRIAAADVPVELDIVWRREMIGGAYQPSWVKVETGFGVIDAVAFRINREHERYVAAMAEDTLVDTLAFAEGRLGSCYDYLVNTVDHLRDLGLEDPHLERLRALATARRAARPKDGGQMASEGGPGDRQAAAE